MAIEVAKVELKNVQDASGVEARIRNGQFKSRRGDRRDRQDRGQWRRERFYPHPRRPGVCAVLKNHGGRSEKEIAKIPMVWSGGCDGVITPHATIFARNAKTGPAVSRGW